jgi:hypothetical protein
VHYFDLMDKLNECDLSPTEYEKGAFGEATDSAEYAVHN